jgi:uncharacterized protein YbcI
MIGEDLPGYVSPMSTRGARMAGDEEHVDRGDGGAELRREGVTRDLSQAMVRIYREQFGRGPETVTTRFSGPDVIISLLGNSLTPVERSMLKMGEDQRLRDVRSIFQHATAATFRAEVERITGRRVIGFMSDIDVHNDLSCEIFTLEPADRGA